MPEDWGPEKRCVVDFLRGGGWMSLRDWETLPWREGEVARRAAREWIEGCRDLALAVLLIVASGVRVKWCREFFGGYHIKFMGCDLNATMREWREVLGMCLVSAGRRNGLPTSCMCDWFSYEKDLDSNRLITHSFTQL